MKTTDIPVLYLALIAEIADHQNTNPTDIPQHNAIPDINGSVNVRDGIENFFAENAKIPFVTAAQTAQDQITNGTVLGGHTGVTQGYLTYTYIVLDPTNDRTQSDRRCWKRESSEYVGR